MPDPSAKNFWNLSSDEVLVRLQTKITGLTENEVLQRQKQYGLNVIHKRKINVLAVFVRQFTNNPLILILAIATLASFTLGQHISSYYIFAMIMVSVILGFWNEYSAEKTIDNLLKKISPTALLIRDGQKIEIPVSQLTIGDIVLLSQGSIIPADLRLIETKNLEVNQAVLTGEAKTNYKTNEAIADGSLTLGKMGNIGFMGTMVESGSGKGVVVKIGKDTEFGKIAQSVTYLKPATAFQKGLSGFGQLIIKVVVILTISIFVINFLLGHNWLESLLFALAIAVGLTPELLPVIVTVSLSHGAGKLAKKHVVPKRLISIENLGNMDVLCTDKTGTLTEGKIEVIDFINAEGEKDPKILDMSLQCNSAIVHHKVIGNGIDTALWEYALKHNIKIDNSVEKIDEEPFDFNRKAMYVVTSDKETNFIAKGAPETIVGFCQNFKNKKNIQEKIISLNRDGFRIIAVASKKIPQKQKYSWDDVSDLTFEGYITFLDVPKKTVKESLQRLNSLHVLIKVITGDSELVAQKICKEVGMENKNVLLGSEIDLLSEEGLQKKVNETTIFARVNPQQKLRIIQALQKNGHTVGYLGDGINDLPALHSADVGISVNTAVDVAKDAATIVLLRKSLDVIADGIMEGRKTFSNTIKYILMGTSSNFGNMFSAAGASFFLPFLPMTPLQILLTNGLYDISQLSIPSDNVDRESLIKPRRWNINFIKNYMLFFGPLSSIYDFLTFGVLLYVFNARGALFQTGWFVESVATEILVVFVIRTARTPFFLSKPSIWLALTCLFIVGIAPILPFTGLASHLGFVPLPPLYFLALILLVSTYLLLVETVKSVFLKKYIP